MANSRVPKETVAAAVKKAGDHVKLGRHLNATYQAVSYWLRHGAPPWRQQAIEAYLREPARKAAAPSKRRKVAAGMEA